MTATCAGVGLYVGACAVDLLPLFPEPFFYHVKTAIFEHQYYAQFALKNWYKAIPFFSLPAASMLGAAYGAWLFFGRLIDPIVHVRGRQLWRGDEAIKRAIFASKKMLKQSSFGVTLLPQIHISRDQLLKSILVCGSQGGGKTVFINQLLLQLIELNHKLVIFDPVKGDYSRWVPMSAGLCLISSTDARSMHWWLGYDLQDEPDASAFAEGLVEASSDPLWSNAARLILVGIIVHLQKTYGKNWSWQELSDCLNLEMSDLHELLKADYPPAATFADPESKTSQSMEKNLKAFTAPIFRLAKTWSKIDPKKRFSFKQWLDNDNTKHRRIIVQMNQKDGALGAAISRAIISFSTNHIASLEFSESKTRLIGYFLDEVPAFRKLESLIKINEIGRSKGVFTLVGFQDSSQISQIYGKEELQKWGALFGLRVFPQVVGADSQKWVCEQIGEREVQYRQKNVSGTGTGQLNVSSSYSQPQSAPVLLPSELELFGKQNGFIESLFLGLGKDALALRIDFPPIQDIRDAHVPWPTVQPQAQAKTEHSSEVFETSKAARAAASNSNMAQQPTEITTEAAHAESATDNTTQTEMLEILSVNEPQKPTEITQNNEDATQEIIGEVAESAAIHVIAETLGVPTILLEVAENLADLQAPQTQNNQMDMLSQPLKKRLRKQRKYENEAA